jgi:hypothetical protein
MPSKFLRVKMAAVTGLALLSIGGVAAAAAGLAPGSAERAATQASPRTPDGQVGHAQGEAATLIHRPDGAAATDSSTPDKSSDHATGPDASGAARHGLCQAWLAGQGDDHGKRADAPAFQALAAAAGGVDQIAAYCQAELGDVGEPGGRPAAPPGGAPVRTAPPNTGPPPEDPRRGNGQGGPPTTA